MILGIPVYKAKIIPVQEVGKISIKIQIVALASMGSAATSLYAIPKGHGLIPDKGTYQVVGLTLVMVHVGGN